MSEALKQIFKKIAKRLGLELKEKNEVVNYDFSSPGLNPTVIGASSIATITIDDSEIAIAGESERAKRLEEICEYFTDEVLPTVAEVALGTGDCLARPYTDGKGIGIDIIGNNDFAITKAIGNKIKGVVIKIAEYTANNSTYILTESQELKDENGVSVCSIRRFAYKDGKEIPLISTDWKDYDEEQNIISDVLLVGRYKCPTVNRKNYNSPNGVPITYGCDDIIGEIKKQYKEYNDEFTVKRSRIFADRSLFKKDTTGNLKLSPSSEYVTVNGDLNNGVGSMIQEYSPNIREAEHRAGSDFNFGILEMCCGFSRGVFTKPETAFATATEMKNSLKKTFSFVKAFRARIEAGDRGLFEAINVIMNLNNITPVGTWEIYHDWSYDYVEETRERFTQLVQSLSVGAIKKSDLTSWVLNMDREQAEEYIAEIEVENEQALERELDRQPAE